MKVNKKTIIIISLSMLGIAAVSASLLVTRRSRSMPDFSKKAPEQIREYLRSEEFRELDPNTRRTYVRTAMRQMISQSAKEYCELASEEKTAYLDKVIDDMEERRREFRARREQYRPQNGADIEQRLQQRQQSRPRRRTPRPERMRARTESVDATTRAQISEFFQALRKRRQERGMDDNRFPGRRF